MILRAIRPQPAILASATAPLASPSTNLSSRAVDKPEAVRAEILNTIAAILDKLDVNVQQFPPTSPLPQQYIMPVAVSPCVYPPQPQYGGSFEL